MACRQGREPLSRAEPSLQDTTTEERYRTPRLFRAGMEIFSWIFFYKRLPGR